MLSGHEVDYPREITEREAAGNDGQCQHYHRPQNAPDYVRLYDNHSVYHNGVSRNLARESQADLIPPDSPMTADSSQQDFSEAKGASGAASKSGMFKQTCERHNGFVRWQVSQT